MKNLPKGATILNHQNTAHSENQTIDHLAQAIFIVNRHAKTAPNPKYLYRLKHEAIKKLLTEGKAKKLGLHFSQNPKFSQQQSDVLVKCGRYSFHIPPTKQDFRELPHLGKLDRFVRNPKTRLPLSEAKRLLEMFVGMKENKLPSKRKPQRKNQKPIFKPLGESYF